PGSVVDVARQDLEELRVALGLLPVIAVEPDHSDIGGKPDALRLIGNRPLLRMRFEDVLRDPLTAAIKLQRFIGVEEFDVAAAALAVRHRSAACASGLDMEIALMETAGA
ncbi:MAG TPA: hypothetical protein VNV16_09985, partial [Methylibium sp.]|nr:hypothetical protein [Methylibium sp.]